MAVRTGKGKADKGTSTSIREGVRLPEQGGGLTPERKSPRTPTLRFRERKTIGCSGESARRPRKGKTSAGPGESIHIPGGRRGSSGQAGGGREQHTCREARIRRRHSRTRQANGKKNITELFAGFRKYSIFALAIPKWCVSSAVWNTYLSRTGSGVRVPYAPPANRRENPRRQETKNEAVYDCLVFRFPASHGGTDGERRSR